LFAGRTAPAELAAGFVAFAAAAEVAATVVFAVVVAAAGRLTGSPTTMPVESTAAERRNHGRVAGPEAEKTAIAAQQTARTATADKSLAAAAKRSVVVKGKAAALRLAKPREARQEAEMLGR